MLKVEPRIEVAKFKVSQCWLLFSFEKRNEKFSRDTGHPQASPTPTLKRFQPSTPSEPDPPDSTQPQKFSHRSQRHWHPSNKNNCPLPELNWRPYHELIESTSDTLYHWAKRAVRSSRKTATVVVGWKFCVWVCWYNDTSHQNPLRNIGI